jgi:hypothetical protein
VFVTKRGKETIMETPAELDLTQAPGLTPERYERIVKTLTGLFETGGAFGVGENSRGQYLIARGKYGCTRRFPNKGPYWLACLEAMNRVDEIRKEKRLAREVGCSSKKALTA